MEIHWITCLTFLIFAGFVTSSDYYADADYLAQDAYMSDWSKDWAMLSGRLNQPKCVDIPQNMSLCRGIGYTQMRLPNLLDHDTIGEVTQQAKSWVPLLGIQCHPDTKLFLCSLFSPVCLDRPIWPCRSLCQNVQDSCETFMMKYGFPWPEMLRCDKFPLDNDLCIGLQNEPKKDDKICEACEKPNTYESLLDNFCSADFVLKMRIESNVISTDGRIKITPQKKKKRFYKKENLKRRDIRNLILYIEKKDKGDLCECPLVDEAVGSKDYFLVMGKKQGDALVITNIQPFVKKDKDQRRAMKDMRKNMDICKTGFDAITSNKQRDTLDLDTQTTTTKKNRNNSNVNNKRDNKNRKRDKSLRDRSQRRKRKQRERNLNVQFRV